MDFEHTPYRQFALMPHLMRDKLTTLLRDLNILHPDDRAQSRPQSMLMFVENLNHQPDATQRDWISKFNEMAFQSVEGQVPMLGISYFHPEDTVYSHKLSDFLNAKGFSDQDDFEINNFFEFNSTSQLSTVYRHLQASDEKITAVTWVFGKRYLAQQAKDPERAAFVVLTINLTTGLATFNLPYATGQIRDIENNVIPTQLFQDIQKKLLRDGIQFRLDNTRQLIFSLYKGITTLNEKKYLDEIDSKILQDRFVQDFYTESLARLSLNASDDSIQFCSRLKSLYLRLLISKDFNAFKEFVEKSQYSVQGFLFSRC